MGTTRRDFVRVMTGTVLAAGNCPSGFANGAEATDAAALPIVDTHQHLWDLSKFQLAWLDGATGVLKKSYQTKEYREATEGLNVVKAVYMEVDVVPRQHVAEAEDIVALCRSGSA
ncbi:amidohydrolase family protein, partial [Singulisphaera rosea]